MEGIRESLLRSTHNLHSSSYSYVVLLLICIIVYILYIDVL